MGKYKFINSLLLIGALALCSMVTKDAGEQNVFFGKKWSLINISGISCNNQTITGLNTGNVFHFSDDTTMINTASNGKSTIFSYKFASDTLVKLKLENSFGYITYNVTITSSNLILISKDQFIFGSCMTRLRYNFNIIE